MTPWRSRQSRVSWSSVINSRFPTRTWTHAMRFSKITVNVGTDTACIISNTVRIIRHIIWMPLVNEVCSTFCGKAWPKGWRVLSSVSKVIIVRCRGATFSLWTKVKWWGWHLLFHFNTTGTAEVLHSKICISAWTAGTIKNTLPVCFSVARTGQSRAWSRIPRWAVTSKCVSVLCIVPSLGEKAARKLLTAIRRHIYNNFLTVNEKASLIGPDTFNQPNVTLENRLHPGWDTANSSKSYENINFKSYSQHVTSRWTHK